MGAQSQRVTSTHATYRASASERACEDVRELLRQDTSSLAPLMLQPYGHNATNQSAVCRAIGERQLAHCTVTPAQARSSLVADGKSGAQLVLLISR